MDFVPWNFVPDGGNEGSLENVEYTLGPGVNEMLETINHLLRAL